MVSMRRTFCRICEAACGLEAELDDGGRVVKLRPDRAHPISRGYACAKGTRFHESARHPDRLARPEVDGRDAGWDEAIATAAGRIDDVRRRYGPNAVGIYFGNPLAFNSLGLAAMIGFMRALGSRNVYYAGTQDCANKFAGAQLVYGSPVVHAVPDFARTRLAVVLGSNPYVSQSSFVHLEGGGPAVFGGIIERGGDVVWVDPRRTESASKWGHHLAIRPGTDAWLLLALIGLLADDAPRERARIEGADQLLEIARAVDIADAGRHTGLGRDAIEALARQIRSSDATTFHMSVGVNQSGFGTLCYVLLQALAWVSGNLDRAGGMVFNPTSRVFERGFRIAGLDRGAASRVGGFSTLLGSLPGGILADELLTEGDERVRAMLVVAGDPLRSVPGGARLQRALTSLDTLVCVDMFRSRTAAHADVVLPATSWLERWDVATTTIPFQVASLVQAAGPVVAPHADARHDHRILSDLAIAMNLPGPWRLGRLPWTKLLPAPRRGGFRAPRVRPGSFLRRRTVTLWNDALARELARLEATVPGDSSGRDFVLMCRRRRLGHNSWLHGGTREGAAEACAWMRAEDLAALGLDQPGRESLVEIETQAGRMRLPVAAHEGLPPRTVVVPHGLPDLDVNALIPAGPEHVERLSGQHRMTAIPASVRLA